MGCSLKGCSETTSQTCYEGLRGGWHSPPRRGIGRTG